MSKKKPLTASEQRHKTLVARLNELPDSIFFQSLFGDAAWDCTEEECDALVAGAPWAPILRAHGVAQ
jgi:hypothetical protein